jgi:hypothetical protein
VHGAEKFTVPVELLLNETEALPLPPLNMQEAEILTVPANALLKTLQFPAEFATNVQGTNMLTVPAEALLNENPPELDPAIKTDDPVIFATTPVN